MQRFIFKGFVLPQGARVTINNPPRIGWKSSDQSLSMEFTLSIENSQIVVFCDADRDDGQNQIPEMLMRASDIARTAINLVAFKSAHGLSVFLDSITYPDGRETKIMMHDRFSDGLCTSYNLDDARFGEIMHSIFSEPGWFLALNDLIETVQFSHCGPRNCFRAVEAIRNLVNGGPPQKGKEASSWELMHQQLNTTKKYLDPITSYSTGSRHGATDFVPYDVMADIKRRTWIVMDRFMHWKLTMGRKLSEIDFPILN